MFGFGKGVVDLQLEKLEFSPGEEVRTLTLQLKAPQRAARLVVQLTAEQKAIQGIGTSRRRTRTKLYDFAKPLDGEKVYPAGEKSYPFGIRIPSTTQSVGGMLGTAVRAAQLLTFTSTSIEWKVTGKLDVPQGMDVSKSVKISVI